MKLSHEMTTGHVDVNGSSVHYDKFGTGPEILLLIPGAIGTGKTDFKAQIEGPHAFDQEKYTLICIELPGWGRSRPPERKFDKNVYINDAYCALKLMDTLGYKSYSILGWSEGGKVALVMSYKAPVRVKSVVVTSIFMIVNARTCAPTIATQNTNNWPIEMREDFEKVYGDDFQKMWDGYINFSKVYVNTFPSGYWTNDLQSIRCPVLIFHGDLDPLVAVQHALYAEKQIPYSQLHRFPKGTHNCHQKYSGEYKRITEHFFKEVNQYH